MSSKILVLPGDGIGVEVADQAIRVIDKLNELLVLSANANVHVQPVTSIIIKMYNHNFIT